MEYKAYKLQFPVGIHIGSGSLEDSEKTFGADTLFSALCIEANKKGKDDLETLAALVRDNGLLFSDALPYIGDQLYLPKPILHIEADRRGDSSEKKAFKKLEYIPVERLSQFLLGQMDAGAEYEYFKRHFGRAFFKVSASIGEEENVVPYRIGLFQFQLDAGLYIIIGYEDRDTLLLVEELLTGLSFEGIGGKRSLGLGRFVLKPFQMGDELLRRLHNTGRNNMSLSVCLPTDEELESAMQEAGYLLEKRSGFVVSDTYAETNLRKKDLFVFRAGSCFRNTFGGDVYDVSVQGRHPVYRYAKPMFMGVDI
ncbi:MAG: type III-A CRISPR-associated RAMP protein Csm4 [Lachnospiraceae bacterium]|nr:type III-A CRISPR-associated RAMP protein Csm4 [Lachnospiraceae bacterium]